METLKEKLKVRKSLITDLEEAYDEALKNEEFKKFVSKIKLKRNILIKYTSSLEESFKEYNNCQNCKNILECQNKLKGYAFLPRIKNEALEFAYKPCKYKIALDKKNKFYENTLVFNEPLEIKEASLKKIYKTDKNRYKVIIWLTDFIQRYKQDKNQKGLYLHGNFGSGKTYLISATFNELAKEGIKTAVIFWPEYLHYLKTLFNTNEFASKFNEVKKAPLLLIDDLGAENNTPWARDEILCSLLQYRMDEKLPTFFTSNLDLTALEKHLATTSFGIEEVKAGRIIARIKQLTETEEMVSKNLRK